MDRCNKCNGTRGYDVYRSSIVIATSGAGTAYPSGAPEFIPGL